MQVAGHWDQPGQRECRHQPPRTRRGLHGHDGPVPTTMAAAQALKVTWTEVATTFGHMLVQLQHMAPHEVWPAAPMGRVATPLLLGRPHRAKGYTQRPAIPGQQQIECFGRAFAKGQGNYQLLPPWDPVPQPWHRPLSPTDLGEHATKWRPRLQENQEKIRELRKLRHRLAHAGA